MELPTPVELKSGTRDRVGFVLNQGLILQQALDLKHEPNKNVIIEAAEGGFPTFINRVAHVGQQNPDRFLSTHMGKASLVGIGSSINKVQYVLFVINKEVVTYLTDAATPARHRTFIFKCNGETVTAPLIRVPDRGQKEMTDEEKKRMGSFILAAGDTRGYEEASTDFLEECTGRGLPITLGADGDFYINRTFNRCIMFTIDIVKTDYNLMAVALPQLKTLSHGAKLLMHKEFYHEHGFKKCCYKPSNRPCYCTEMDEQRVARDRKRVSQSAKAIAHSNKQRRADAAASSSADLYPPSPPQQE